MFLHALAIISLIKSIISDIYVVTLHKEHFRYALFGLNHLFHKYFFRKLNVQGIIVD